MLAQAERSKHILTVKTRYEQNRRGKRIISASSSAITQDQPLFVHRKQSQWQRPRQIGRGQNSFDVRGFRMSKWTVVVEMLHEEAEKLEVNWICDGKMKEKAKIYG